MKIYELLGDYKNYAAYDPDREDLKKRVVQESYTYIMCSRSDGKPWGDAWHPRVLKLDTYEADAIGDFVFSPGENIPAMSERAIEILRDCMGDFEMLPVKCDFGDNFWGVNILNVLEDFTDFEKSEYIILGTRPVLPNGHPNVIDFKKRVFIPEKIIGYHIFRDADHPRKHAMVDDVFVDTVKKNGLTGCRFELIWEN